MTYEKNNRKDFEERIKMMVGAGYTTVAKEIIKCTRCPLHKSAIRRVIGKRIYGNGRRMQASISMESQPKPQERP
jgi:hypothetical protein